MRCLIIDDEEDNIFILTKIVKDLLNFSIVTAKDAESALTICKTGLPNVIFLDWKLPGMSGLEFVNKLKEEVGENKFGSTKIIMCTGMNERKDVEDAIKSGVAGYLVKPFFKDDIADHLEKIGYKTNRKPKMVISQIQKKT